MIHPNHLRAAAAAWSLKAALAILDTRIAAEDQAIRAEQEAAADPLKSPVWGQRRALGGHSDPTADAIDTIGAVYTQINRWAELDDDVRGQLLVVAATLPPIGTGGLARIAVAVPGMSETAAVATRRLLDRIDGRIRRLLHEPDDRQLVPRVRCPDCDAVALVLRTSAPPAERVIECTTCDGAWARNEMLRSVDA